MNQQQQSHLIYLMALRDKLQLALQLVRADKNFDELSLEAQQAVCFALDEGDTDE